MVIMGGMVVMTLNFHHEGPGSIPQRSQHKGPNIFSFFHNLASIYFQFCFEYINSRFTMLGLQMFSLAMGSNFRTLQPPQHLILCTHQLSNLCQGSVILPSCGKIQ